MAGLCCFHCMLRLSSEGGTVSFRWLHCRLRLSKREGLRMVGSWFYCRPRLCRRRGRGRVGGFLLASLETEDCGFLLASL